MNLIKELQREISVLGFPNRGSRKMLKQESLRHELRRARALEAQRQAMAQARAKAAAETPFF